MAASPVGTNVTAEVKGQNLVITVPLDKAKGQPSSTGKMSLTGSTHGFVTVPGTEGFRLMLNAGYRN